MTQSIALPIPAAYSLESYIQTVNRYPLLSQEAEQAYENACGSPEETTQSRRRSRSTASPRAARRAS